MPHALERTDGWFDAWRSRADGLFDPTGLTKTWGVTQAARHLDLLPGLGYAVGAGGDILLRPTSDGEPWSIGIEDPRDRGPGDRDRPGRPTAPSRRRGSRRAARTSATRTPARPSTQVLAASVVGAVAAVGRRLRHRRYRPWRERG